MASLKERFERTCRLCAEEHDVTVQIFSPVAESMLLLKKLDKYLLLKIHEEDALPKSMCIKCCSMLQTVSDFIEVARKSQDVLFARRVALEKVGESDKSPSRDSKIKEEPLIDDDDDGDYITEMEVSVDPQMVFQNSESNLSSKDENTDSGDIRFLQGADGENVTIKLIRQPPSLPPAPPAPPPAPKLAPKPVKEVLTLPVVKKINDMNAKPFRCTLCDRSFLSELALKGHVWMHLRDGCTDKTFKCLDQQCDMQFTEREAFLKHLKQHRRQNTCKTCKRIFRSNVNLRIHEASHKAPENARAYVCSICGRSYDRISNLRNHSITHSKERPFNCHVCKKSFKRKQDLKFHVNQHTGNKPFKCPFCDKCFASSGNCYSHRNRMHPGRMVETKAARAMRKVVNLGREHAEPQAKIPIKRLPLRTQTQK